MIVHFIVREFGKVESADILSDNLVLLVGNNNSGKTMVMQLIYGMRKALENFPVPVPKVKRTDLNGQCLIRCDREWFREVEDQVNRYLAENREQIVEGVFGYRFRQERKNSRPRNKNLTIPI